MNKLTRTGCLAIVASLAGISAAQADDSLSSVLASQAEGVQERYPYRHPQETLEFFGIEPGMTVVEILPGGGWYSRILLEYLGPEGTLIGADYPVDMFPLFGVFSPEQLEAKKTWIADWTAKANGWGIEDGAKVSAFQLGSLPEDMKGTADAVLSIRALHNLARFESEGGFLTTAVQDMYDVLKPGGILGVVQHQARDEKSDEWASGNRGYLKENFVIQLFTAAGFEYVGQSDINHNDKDQPGDGDIVWRLPPTFGTSRDNPELQEQMKAIGESNRMTLKFRKPE